MGGPILNNKTWKWWLICPCVVQVIVLWEGSLNSNAKHFCIKRTVNNLKVRYDCSVVTAIIYSVFRSPKCSAIKCCFIEHFFMAIHQTTGPQGDYLSKPIVLRKLIISNKFPLIDLHQNMFWISEKKSIRSQLDQSDYI